MSETNLRSSDHEIRITVPESAYDDLLPNPPSFPKLDYSTPLNSSILPQPHSFDLGDSVDERATGDKEDEKEKKKTRKSVDDSRSKRRDTSTSLSNFFHRFTRSDEKKDDKLKQAISEERLLNRPNKLDLPEITDEKWYESKTVGIDFYKTALDGGGHEAGLPIYEWKADTLEESLLNNLTRASAADLLRVGAEQHDPELDFMERSLGTLLEDFRTGQMRTLTDEQMAGMRLVKKRHEDVTNLHLALYNLDCDDPIKLEEQLDKMYDQLSDNLYTMHAPLEGIGLS